MNKVILMGRITRDIEVRYTAGENAMAIARYTLAVDRKFHKEGEATVDFINCVAFGKAAEFAEKYYHKGIKIVVAGRIQTGSYMNRDGQKVYTTDVVIEEQEFAESKAASQQSGDNQSSSSSRHGTGNFGTQYQQQSMVGADGFMNVSPGIDDDLPFN